MSVTAIDLANAVVARLNVRPSVPRADAPLFTGFTTEFLAERRTAPFSDVELDEMNDLRVVVFYGPTKSIRRGRTGSRDEFQKSYKSIIAVQKKLAGEDADAKQADADTLMKLVQDIENLMVTDLAGLSFVGFDSDQERLPYNPEAMHATSFFSQAMVLEFTS